jgi:phosphohistidine phosphatase
MATAEAIAGKISYPVNNIQIDDIIYDAKNGDELIQLIHKTSEHVMSLMIVGHNPVLSDLATSLVNHGRKIDMSKSSVVKIDIDLTPWKDIKHDKGILVYYKKPVKGNIETIL